MSERIKVEFEISAWGQKTTQDQGDFFQKHEILKIHTLPKDTTLEHLERMAKDIIAEMKSVYPEPEQLGIKVTMRGKETGGLFTYLG